MPWNWELPDWPQFSYQPLLLTAKEQLFFLKMGQSGVFLNNLGRDEQVRFAVELLSLEGIESSKIEGEFLDRESLQSSIKRHFDLRGSSKGESDKESRMAKLLCEVYETYDQPLTHSMLWHWHAILFHQEPGLSDCGCYRTHIEPMQIVSNRLDTYRVFYEAPPSQRVHNLMSAFIDWFNAPAPNESLLARAAIAHLHFESIHPFEDGNGRIGRVLVEKLLSRFLSRPTLLAVSKVLERKRKEYYTALERCNRTLQVPEWVDFFSDAISTAQKESMELLHFLVHKSKLMSSLADRLNPRQEKVLLRVFAEGTSGFKGGLSAENYIAITKTSRATATRDLTDLVQMGALLKTGELRHTRYWLNLPNPNQVESIPPVF